ncbi:hypothetical protein [Ureibacillus manganicus]|uniref:Uncharacterized protein n=1 Tax=Ureibacillus manganicus DSM 26584 TaxID=1384049 RepID=A0A0A3I7J6_9BACL|nr:hypothetical protein [Ureibacillus manganicus]KGR78703.1 hypothetical protein CD29_10015 [Ureibacillus manganicus DSM 26584]
MEIVSYLIKTMHIDRVITDLEDFFCSLDVVIHEEGHDFYLIKFITFNHKEDNFSKRDLSGFDEFFDCVATSVMSYEKVSGIEK